MSICHIIFIQLRYSMILIIKIYFSLICLFISLFTVFLRPSISTKSNSHNYSRISYTCSLYPSCPRSSLLPPPLFHMTPFIGHLFLRITMCISSLWLTLLLFHILSDLLRFLKTYFQWLLSLFGYYLNDHPMRQQPILAITFAIFILFITPPHFQIQN